MFKRILLTPENTLGIFVSETEFSEYKSSMDILHERTSDKPLPLMNHLLKIITQGLFSDEESKFHQNAIKACELLYDYYDVNKESKSYYQKMKPNFTKHLENALGDVATQQLKIVKLEKALYTKAIVELAEAKSEQQFKKIISAYSDSEHMKQLFEILDMIHNDCPELKPVVLKAFKQLQILCKQHPVIRESIENAFDNDPSTIKNLDNILSGKRVGSLHNVYIAKLIMDAALQDESPRETVKLSK